MMETTGFPFGEVMREVAAMTVFTTHTPVAAGHDRFPASLVEEHLGRIREAMHLSYEDFMGLGRVYPGDPNEPFCMTVLALRLSRHANGVSAFMARSRGGCGSRSTSIRPRKMFRSGTSPTESTCKAGSPPRCTCSSTETWEPTGPNTSGTRRPGSGSDAVEDAELWETQQVLKARLINFVRNRLVSQARRREEPDAAIERAMQALDLNALTIGFARRFATYKRSGLILQDVERLIEMVERRRPARPDHLRRQGPSRGPDGQGADPGHRPASPGRTSLHRGSSSSKTTI